MAKPISLTRASLVFLLPKPTGSSTSTIRTLPFSLLFLRSKFTQNQHYFSTTATRFLLQYEMIVSRPVQSPSRRRNPLPPLTKSKYSDEPDPDSKLGFNDWVDRKLASNSSSTSVSPSSSAAAATEEEEKEEMNGPVMDKSKRKYYNKREKRMYGTDFDDDDGADSGENKFVELKQDVVHLRTLHKREEELFFHDAFAYPWEKDKHYKMVYQLEKKYFPDQGFDKAFLDENASKGKLKKKKKVDVGKASGEKEDDKRLVFFEEEREGKGEKDVKLDVTEKKVEEFFKCLKKVPNENENGGDDSWLPFLSTKTTGLPHKWDSATGTAVLVNKPKGWTSFTVCGKLRRLVKVKKVGHAGTLDPMATGLLIVCVGKATKVVDRFQGMIKGYSGVFRLGEATSTLDADSPVIQREPWEHIKDEDIKKAAASFCGEIWQVPPMFSAIKVGGEKMYEKARRGESVELSPRQISIFKFDVERSLDDRQNVIFRVTCSKGTYIRSLCADFAKSLNSCAHLTALRRDSIGEYSADDAWEFKELEEEIPKGYL